MDTPVSHTRTAPPTIDRWWVVPLIGIATGYAVLYTTQMGSAWGVYLLLGVVFAFVLPIIVTATGGLDRLLLMSFVFALQFQLGFNPIYFHYASYKQAGYVGLYISLVLIAAMAVCLVRAVQWLAGRRFEFPVHGPLVRAAFFFFLASALSLINTPNKTVSAFGLWEIASLMLIAAVAGSYAATKERLRLLHTTLLVTVGCQCLIILAENATGAHFSMQGGVTGSGSWETSRFAGTLVVPSVSATFVVIGLFFTAVRLFSAQPSPHRGLLTALLGVGVLVLLLSLTRSAWIAFILGGTGLGLHLYRNGTLGLREIRIVAILGVGGAILAWPALAGRLAENHSNDADVRWNLVVIAMAMIKAHPLIGVGINNATAVVNEYANLAGLGGVWVFIVHNQFMLVAAETGLVGFAAFVSLYAVGIRCAYRAIQSGDAQVRDSAAATFWSLIAMIWSLNLDHIAGGMTYVFLFFLFGLATGLFLLAKSLDEASGAAPVPSAAPVSAA